jgi:hypothetical protein
MDPAMLAQLIFLVAAMLYLLLGIKLLRQRNWIGAVSQLMFVPIMLWFAFSSKLLDSIQLPLWFVAFALLAWFSAHAYFLMKKKANPPTA